jgi:succinate-semialdehyde dehydrogenase/glutarate-semialdehyde dehydrogenase
MPRADMLCAKEETFGPFAPVFKFRTEAGSHFCRQQHRVWPGQLLLQPRHRAHLARGEALEYGMVGVNVGILATEHVPFGGVKQSGLGREGSHHGMDDYVEIKYLCLGDILK